MAYLVDTSILLRLANTNDVLYTLTEQAVATLHLQGESLYITPQVLIEFRNAASRSIEINGLGFTSAEVEEKAESFEHLFLLLNETADIYPAWKSLVHAAGIIGKQVHDARLVAICHVFSLSHVLTFNVRHFTRMAAHPPGIVVVSPKDVIPNP